MESNNGMSRGGLGGCEGKNVFFEVTAKGSRVKVVSKFRKGQEPPTWNTILPITLVDLFGFFFKLSSQIKYQE